MIATASGRHFWRDGDGRLREAPDLAKNLAQRNGRYVAVKAEPSSFRDLPGPAPAAPNLTS